MSTLAAAVFDGTLASWQEAARLAIHNGQPPSDVAWQPITDNAGLFAGFAAPPLQRDGGEAPELPRLFTSLSRSVSCHRDPSRWDLLYAALWRLTHDEPELLSVATDPLVHRLIQMHRNVKRAAHKMKAFVRFRRIDGRVDADTSYVAWFEPAHLVVERTAPFFARRFPSMRWSILTPDRCAHWDRQALTFTNGVSSSEAPGADDLEEIWRTYYANIFNPARLNERAMRSEMPLRYWINLPEARLIADLRAAAPGRVRTMLAQLDAEPEPLPADYLPELSRHGRADAPISPLDVPGEGDPVHDPGVSAARERERNVRASPPFRIVVGATRVDMGVAGWTDPSLLAGGVFYPRECGSAESRLRYYASRYSMVEVDSTYYSLPSRASAAAWAARTPNDFVFDVKAHALMTGHPAEVKRLPDWVRRSLPRGRASALRVYGHELPTDVIDEVWSRFRSALDPLRSSGKLGAIMLQFPRWFTPTREHAAVLRVARARLGDDLATVEFRNRAWMNARLAPRTIALLTELRLSYVIVDAPPGMESSMPATVAVTDPRLAVFRLHGRRVATWEAKNDLVTERYRYLYDAAQLAFWAPRIYETAFDVARVHVTFNNNHANYATTNAAEMADSLASLSAR